MSFQKHVIYEFSLIFEDELIDQLRGAGFVTACTCCGQVIPWGAPTIDVSDTAEHDREVIFHPDHWKICDVVDEHYAWDAVSLQALSVEALKWSQP
jgi:hypothetical protein